VNIAQAKPLRSALLAAVCALTGCVVAPDPYGGPVYGGGYGPYYGTYYGGGYGYGAPAYLPVLPVGATYVYEYGEPRWYYRGTCYRRSSNGYVVVHKKSSDHHSSQSSSQHSKQHSSKYSNQHAVSQTPTRSNRYVTEQKKPATHSQSALSRENRYGSRGDSDDDRHKSSGRHDGHSSKKDSGDSKSSGGGDRKGR